MAAIFGVAAFYAAPALANPCPNETNVFLLTGSSFTNGAHTASFGSGSMAASVTLTVTKNETGGHVTSVSFTLSDDNSTTDWLASRAWVNPGQSGQKEYPVDATADETDNAYDPFVSSASNLTPASGDVTGLKVCLAPQGALAVNLRSVTAKRSARGATVNWWTASEIDVAGYNIYGLVHGKRVKLNSHVIASKGAGANSYSFSYRAAKGQQAPTRLWLQSINMDGSRQWHAARVIR